MSFIYILSLSDFTDRFDLSPNTLQRRYKQTARIVQQKFGSEVICRKTYNEIISQLAQGDGEETYLDEKYVTLLPYIKDYLAAKTYARYVTDSQTISTASGLVVDQDDTSRRLTNEELEVMTRKVESDADFYRDELYNFLQDNKDTYTLWRDSICACNGNPKGAILPGYGPRIKPIIKWS